MADATTTTLLAFLTITALKLAVDYFNLASAQTLDRTRPSQGTVGDLRLNFHEVLRLLLATFFTIAWNTCHSAYVMVAGAIQRLINGSLEVALCD